MLAHFPREQLEARIYRQTELEIQNAEVRRQLREQGTQKLAPVVINPPEAKPEISVPQANALDAATPTPTVGAPVQLAPTEAGTLCAWA